MRTSKSGDGDSAGQLTKPNGKAHGPVSRNPFAGIDHYDPAKFLVPGKDHHGHLVREWCNVPPSIDHELNCIKDSKNWPFRTKGDVIRWCVYEGIRRLETMKPVEGSMMVVAETIIEACRAQELLLKFRSSIDAVEHSVKEFMGAGNEQQALKLLSKIRAEVLKLREDSWREQYLREFDMRFGSIWARQKGKAVRLDSTTKEE